MGAGMNSHMPLTAQGPLDILARTLLYGSRFSMSSTTPPLKRVIAVDGPAASGKSTIARELARSLGWIYINSGALYRAIALALLRANLDGSDVDALKTGLARIQLGLEPKGDRTFLDGQDVTEVLRSREVSIHSSVVAKLPPVREKVNLELRRLGGTHNSVVEGRDIGSVVFPEAELKVFLEASPEERARRRMVEYERLGSGASIEEIGRELAERDKQDATRSVAPLRPPDGAVVCNSTHMTPAQVVDHLLTLISKSTEGHPR